MADDKKKSAPATFNSIPLPGMAPRPDRDAMPEARKTFNWHLEVAQPKIGAPVLRVLPGEGDGTVPCVRVPGDDVEHHLQNWLAAATKPHVRGLPVMVQIRLTDRGSALVGESPPPIGPALCRAFHGAHWELEDGCVGPVLVGWEAIGVVAALDAIQIPRSEWRVIDASPAYLLVHTHAPEAYDGFGSISLGPSFDDHVGYPCRAVAVEREHAAWQVARYRSGSWFARVVEPA